MNLHTITTAAHEAYIDPMTGTGLLVLPRPSEDVYLGSPTGLHGADWDHMLTRLDEVGFEPSEDLDGGAVVEQPLGDGRSVIGLYGRDPIITMPGLEELGAALGELRRCAESCPVS